MNRYILIPEDTIRVLPPEDGVEAAIEIFCSRTVIYFEIAHCFTAADRLLGREQMVLVPTDRADYAAFLAGLRTYAPKTLDFSKEADYIPESCDHNGHHHG